MTYAEKLKDPRWQKKRSAIFTRDHFECTKCGTRDNLTVHHGCYEPEIEPWEFEDATLYTLCWPCHKDAQMALAVVHRTLGLFSPEQMMSLLSSLGGIRTLTSTLRKCLVVQYKVNNGVLF